MALLHQSALPQNPQVAAHRRRSEADSLGQLAGSTRRLAQQVDGSAALRLDPVQWRQHNPGQPLPTSEYGYVGYPTRAQVVVPARELIEVALYDDVLGIIVPLGREQAELLHAWLSSDDPVEFVATGAAFERRSKAAGL
jgi:hypothetical protein